jgi:outer membrane protein assembly factor BamB
VYSSPAIPDGKVYAGSEDGNVYALNAATGALLWTFTTGSSVSSSPAVANGMVYIGSDDNNVYAFGLPKGQAAPGRPIPRQLHPDYTLRPQHSRN